MKKIVTESKIKLPIDLEQDFEIDQTPPQDECYFNFMGRIPIKFSELTAEQAERLVLNKSPYIKRKVKKAVSAT
jgi:hypothetical protein